MNLKETIEYIINDYAFGYISKENLIERILNLFKDFGIPEEMDGEEID